MKTRFVLLAALLSSLFVQCGYSQKKEADKEAGKINGAIAVVELFTSEGCSSCPSADALMPRLKEMYQDNIIILAFHVDYWNRLGWKDRFSTSEFSARQSEYATTFNSENVYTPQAIINGETGITGSDERGIKKLVDNALSAAPATTITLTARGDGAQQVNVEYKTALKNKEVINVALVQQHVVTNVRSGENGGRTLKHYNVVRDFKTLDTGSGTTSFTLPDNLGMNDFHIIAYIQQSDTKHIIAAMETGINK